MKFPVDLQLLSRGAHNPSFFSLQRSLGEAPLKLVDFCVPCNPYFPTAEMFAGWSAQLSETLKYYPSDSKIIGDVVSQMLGVPPDSLVLANGSTELITWIDTLFISKSVATPVPTFGRWTDQPKETGKKVHLFPLEEAEDFRFRADRFIRFVETTGSRAAVLCNPNNPTGEYISKEEMLKLVDALAHLELVVIDESFIDFVTSEQDASLAGAAIRRKNVIVLKSLGKNFGLHGLRIGYAVANPDIIAKIARRLPPWNINSLAETVLFSIAGNMTDYRASLPRIAADRTYLEAKLSEIEELLVFPSQANFTLVRMTAGEGRDAISGRNYLLTEHGVFVRECGNKVGMGEGYLRIANRPRADTGRLLEGLNAFLTIGS